MSETINSRYTVYSAEGYIDTFIGLFHVCRGPRPGGHFLQYEAWEARKVAVKSTARAIRRVVLND